MGAVSASGPDLDELFVRFSLDLVADGPLSDLHWGLWDGLPEDPARFREAQAAYSDRVLALIPPGSQRLVDVGCGLGGLLHELVGAGHEATGLTPVADHAAAIRGAGLPVVVDRFEDWVPDQPVDGLLFAESWAFFGADLDGHLARCRAAVRPGGWLVLADLIDERHLEVLRTRLVIEEAHDLTESVRFTAEVLQRRLEQRVGAYDRLLRGAVRSVDPQAAEALERALDGLRNQAVASVLRGQMPEARMLRRKRYWLIRARWA